MNRRFPTHEAVPSQPGLYYDSWAGMGWQPFDGYRGVLSARDVARFLGRYARVPPESGLIVLHPRHMWEVTLGRHESKPFRIVWVT